MPDPNPPLSTQIADFLEKIASRIREMTVDRAAFAITWMAIAIIALFAGMTALIWLVVGIFRALGELIGVETAYAVVGLILILAGVFVWSRRYPQDHASEQE